jgi:hypothetical protein
VIWPPQFYEVAEGWERAIASGYRRPFLAG